MLRTLRLAGGAAAVLLASAALAQPPAKAPAAPGAPATPPAAAGTDLFPLKAKSKWVYKVADQEVTVVATGTEKVGAEECTKLETQVGGQAKASELYYVKPDGVYRAKVKEFMLDPAVKMLALPAKKDTAWKVDTKVELTPPGAVKGEFKVTDEKAKVTVPAGSFEAVLVEGTDFDVSGSKVTVKQWYVAGKGMVKTTYLLQGNETTLELKEYVEGK